MTRNMAKKSEPVQMLGLIEVAVKGADKPFAEKIANDLSAYSEKMLGENWQDYIKPDKRAQITGKRSKGQHSVTGEWENTFGSKAQVRHENDGLSPADRMQVEITRTLGESGIRVSLYSSGDTNGITPGGQGLKISVPSIGGVATDVGLKIVFQGDKSRLALTRSGLDFTPNAEAAIFKMQGILKELKKSFKFIQPDKLVDTGEGLEEFITKFKSLALTGNP
jgi:hypothetical protein